MTRRLVPITSTCKDRPRARSLIAWMREIGCVFGRYEIVAAANCSVCNGGSRLRDCSRRPVRRQSLKRLASHAHRIASGIVAFAALSLATPAWLAQAKAPQESSGVPVSGRNCAAGPHVSPEGGPFAFFLFCDDALGTQMAVLSVSMSVPQAQAWSLADRVWQQAAWATDVVSVAWLEQGKALLVITGYVYGNASIYRLVLPTREVVRIFPSARVPTLASESEKACSESVACDFELVSVDESAREVRVRVSRCEAANYNCGAEPVVQIVPY